MRKSIMFTMIILLITATIITPCLAGDKGRGTINKQHIYGDLGGEWWVWA